MLKKFRAGISELKFEKILHASLNIGQPENETKMSSSGIFIFNPPWQLDEKLRIILPQILTTLKKTTEASFEITAIKNP